MLSTLIVHAVTPTAAPTYQSSVLVAGTPNQTLTYSTTITKAGTLAVVRMTLPAGATISDATRVFGNTGPGTWAFRMNTIVFTITKPYAIPAGNRPWVMVSGITLPSASSATVTIGVYDVDGSLLSSGVTPAQTFTPPKACRPAMPATYVKTENALAGTPDWRLKTYDPAKASVYASQASAKCGDTVTMYVKSSWYKLSVKAYRMGYYAGSGARQILSTVGDIRAYNQPAPLMVQTDDLGRDISMPTAKNWSGTFSFKVDGSFTPGSYLIKVTDALGAGSYVPLTIRDDGGIHDKTILNSVTTWQAYNTFGGASAYTTPIRSKRVSFDRPFTTEQGTGQFLSLEYGFIFWAEKQGLDVNYATDMDLHSKSLYDHTKTLVLMAHSEYWSTAMRAKVDTAVTQGKNLASFGGNQMYWRVNPKPSTLTGVDREYEIFRTGDTNQFRLATPPAPEQKILGSMFGCMHMDDTLTPNNSWLWNGVDKTPILHYARGETDQVFKTFDQPSGLQVLTSVPLTQCGVGTNPLRADLTAVIHPGGGRVFNASTHAWGCILGGSCSGTAPPTPLAQQQLSQATLNVFAWINAGTPTLSGPPAPTGPPTVTGP